MIQLKVSADTEDTGDRDREKVRVLMVVVCRRC